MSSLPYPRAKACPEALKKHGKTRIDPYLWMHALDSVEMLEHLASENAYARDVLRNNGELEDQLFHEMLARIQETDCSIPVRFGGWMYYSRTEQNLQYAIHCRKRIIDELWSESAEEILLDENKEAAGKAHYEVGDYEISPSGRYMAWTEDTKGERSYRLRLRDLSTGKNLRQSRRDVASLCWGADDANVFYVAEETRTHRPRQLRLLHLATSEDQLLFDEADERFNLLVFKTRSQAYVILSSSSHTTSEVRILPANRPEGRWRIVRRRRAGIEYEVDHHSDHLLVRINDTGPNFRLVKAPASIGEPNQWLELIPHRTDVVLEAVDVYRDWLVASERKAGTPRLHVFSLTSGNANEITFNDPAFVVDIDDLPDWETRVLRYTYESMTTPDSVFEYDPLLQTSTLLRAQPVLGGFAPEHYRSERIVAHAKDGTPVPISLVYRADRQEGGISPLWLEGYGAYGMASEPWFSSTRLSLLDRGWIFAIAHVRGGGELGQAWHEAGRLEHKQNSFTDFIACARTLIELGYTAPGKILAQGGSAGGLLIAAVLNMCPELFGAAILEVPFVDVVTTMLDPSLPLTVGEYEEWGDPRRKQDYLTMLTYSPYDNIRPQSYPPILIETGLHDSQVMAWEPAKYATKLRQLKTDDNPVLLLTNLDAGHGGASGRYDSLHERARQFAFAIRSIQPFER
ncbi:MAG: S9 family peptidase [Uliginosibacterium sp.]|nr:S9 family peptidase [Uliginosibacterium sp.]